MIEQLDKRIIALETELEELRRRKIDLLQQQIAAIQASLSGNSSASPPKASTSSRDGGNTKSGKGWVADLQPAGGRARKSAGPGSGKSGPKKRGRRPGKRIPDEQMLPSIAKLVSASGKEGISARKVSDAIGVFYPRVAKIMEKHFKRTGARKWSRYHLK
jgi:hypothetical protein